MKKCQNSKDGICNFIEIIANQFVTLFVNITFNTLNIYVEPCQWSEMNCAQLNFQKMVWHFKLSVFFISKIANQKVFFVIGDPVECTVVAVSCRFNHLFSRITHEVVEPEMAIIVQAV